ncbi:hypothetical protein FHR83_006813 [Actinoplanes campanulatus]|uniref:Uncharacterized protein n=1 Tax=Actinoplanes campanulatus TaxID=113559 RepID=A0A7W5AMN5_9ACTN|nr:hypothetical protein [Actinoplanes campanulatus]MBB3099107.1 hypothetical protein [Actinoplanes campanulatus]GGN39019.1 hypothetical protein GCM10010109_66460 [Actinoplanes campanulatus]GID40263.1 hypothetical protein Aca09nite_67690 [Actinoplanes campanulatus]
MTLPAIGATATMTTSHGTVRIRITDPNPDPQRQPTHVLGDIIGGTDQRFRYSEPVLLPLNRIIIDPTEVEIWAAAAEDSADVAACHGELYR